MFERNKELHAKIEGLTQLEKYGVKFLVDFIENNSNVDIRKDGKYLRARYGKAVTDSLDISEIPLTTADIENLIKETRMEMLLSNSDKPFTF